MLEIRISNTVAVQFLIDRMEKELHSRIKSGIYSKEITLNKLPFEQLLEITEIAVFDLVTLLPYDVMLKDTNINEVASKAVRSLASIFNIDAFNFYVPEKIDAILTPLKKRFRQAEEEKNFPKN